jgi:glycerol-3-phosphate acyltransferase PlsY
MERGHRTVLHALALALGYAIGSLQLSPLVARRHGVDLRRTGDGNPGAWNALEQLGPRRAAPAFVLDGLKGSAAGLAGLGLAGWWAGWLGVLGAMLGHAFPAGARFRGGKSVMTFVGGVTVLAPVAGAVCWTVCGVVTAVRSFRWGARAGTFAVPLAVLAVGPRKRLWPILWLMAVIGARFGADAARRRRSGPASADRAARPRAST